MYKIMNGFSYVCNVNSNNFEIIKKTHMLKCRFEKFDSLLALHMRNILSKFEF